VKQYVTADVDDAIFQMFPNCVVPPGGAVGPLGGKRVVGKRDIFILIEIWAQEKIYMLVGNLLG
jgi:hypothetical protein